MGSWVEKFDGPELSEFGCKMCKFLEELKSHISDEKVKKKIRRKQLMFLEDPRDIQLYEKKKGKL